MEKYAPLIFEECYVKHKTFDRIQNTFELHNDEAIKAKIHPNNIKAPNYNGNHLFVMCHGF